MDINGSARFRHRKSPSSDRFLDAFSPTPPRHGGSLLNSSAVEDTELNEDDIFSTGDFSAESSRNHHYQQQKHHLSHNHHIHTSPSSSASSSPRPKSFPVQPDSFGILAALPENRTGSHHHQHLYQKTALSSSPSSTASSSSNSSSRLIPSIPKPPQDRLPSSSSFSKHHHPQSAPVNVPVLSKAMRRRDREIDEIDEDENEDDGEMLPPHEIVARSQTPDVAFSVLEGVGRTLKGRDLRQVHIDGPPCIR
ncbi:hypothetical protein LINPERPRIM_LOCUS22456 [Linum perenne]